jgi:hypothetical protein
MLHRKKAQMLRRKNLCNIWENNPCSICAKNVQWDGLLGLGPVSFPNHSSITRNLKGKETDRRIWPGGIEPVEVVCYNIALTTPSPKGASPAPKMMLSQHQNLLPNNFDLGM